MKEVTKEDIKMVVQGILGGFYKEIHEKHIESVEAFIESCEDDLLSFSNYSYLVKNEQREFEEVLLTHLLVEDAAKSEDVYDLDTVERIKIMYQHVDLIENHLSQIFQDEEGSAFSSDKARHVMNGYRKYLTSGKLPDWGERKEYWQPNFGKVQLWMDFVEGIPMVALGIMDKYLEARTELLDDIRKAKEIAHEERHKVYIDSEYYIGLEEKDGLFIYRFEEDNLIGELVLSDSSRGGYRCFNMDEEGNQTRLRGIEELPEWFNALAGLI